MKTKVWAATAAICLGVGGMALADDVRLGTLDVRYLVDGRMNYSGFGGPVETLSFTAERGDVFCKEIYVTYIDGRRDSVLMNQFLRDGRPTQIDVPGRAKRVDTIDFQCHSLRRGADIRVGADIGRHRDAWRHDRDWQGRWASILGGDIPPPPDRDRRDRFDSPPPPPNFGRDDRWDDRRDDRRDDRGGGRDLPMDWMVLDHLSFEGKDDSEQTFGGWRGRDIDRLALRAVNHTARCNRIVATFRNGEQANLGFDRKLTQGNVVVFDLPGGHRDLRDLYLRCHPFGDRQVTIEILVRK